MAAPNMSQAEINRRKKAQGHISVATGTLGLTGLGLLALSSKKVNPSVARAVKKIPNPKKREFAQIQTDRAKLKAYSAATAVTAGGIGGAGSFNFAAYQKAEARQRKNNAAVKKNDNISAFGVAH